MRNSVKWVVCWKTKNIFKLSKLQTTREEGIHHSCLQGFMGDVLRSIPACLNFRPASVNCNLTPKLVLHA